MRAECSLALGHFGILGQDWADQGAGLSCAAWIPHADQYVRRGGPGAFSGVTRVMREMSPECCTGEEGAWSPPSVILRTGGRARRLGLGVWEVRSEGNYLTAGGGAPLPGQGLSGAVLLPPLSACTACWMQQSVGVGEPAAALPGHGNCPTREVGRRVRRAGTCGGNY